MKGAHNFRCLPDPLPHVPSLAVVWPFAREFYFVRIVAGFADAALQAASLWAGGFVPLFLAIWLHLAVCGVRGPGMVCVRVEWGRGRGGCSVHGKLR